MNKLIIQIPCYNEEQTLPHLLKELPRAIQGIDQVEWLVINDGSWDETVKVAKELGVDHVISHTKNQGLAKAFYSGLQFCLKQNADFIVNTDADNQYCSADIIKLVNPLLQKQADMVVGARPIDTIAHFPFYKKILQKLGSYVVRKVSKTEVADAPSGFRAFSKEAAKQLNVFTGYTYTIETLIQAGLNGLKVISVPIRVNPDLRPSRLVRNIPTYVIKSFITIIRSFVVYRPFQFFAWPGITSFLFGLLLACRFMGYYFLGQGNGHVQSVILSSFLMMLGILFLCIGFLADLINANQKLLKNIELMCLNQQKTS